MARQTVPHLQGELQLEAMRALWRLGRPASVDDVRAALPARRRGAYTTVQTILNRLAERNLLTRERQGKAMFYAPRIGEADYYSRSVNQTLATASEDARRSALAQLVAGMEPGERDEIETLARGVAAEREGREEA